MEELKELAIRTTRDILVEYLKQGLYCRARTVGNALESLLSVREDFEVAPPVE